MIDTSEYSQKNTDTQTRFTFEKKSFRYFVKDKHSKGEFTIPYDSVKPDISEVSESNDLFKNYSIYCFMVALIYIPIAIFSSAKNLKVIFAPFFLVAAIIFYYLYIRSKATYLVLQSSIKTIYIIKDHQHDEILQRILNERKNIYLAEYGTVNLKNNPVEELKRFEWLLEQKVITQTEYEKIAELLPTTNNIKN